MDKTKQENESGSIANWWRSQRRPFAMVGAFFYLPTLLVIFAAMVFAATTKVDPRYLLKDPIALTNLPRYAGVLSNIGILLWSAAASVCFFTAFTLPKTADETEERQFLLGAGLVTSVLMIDDFFLIHEQFGKTYSKVLIAGYGVFAALVFFRYRRIIYQNAPALLLLSLALLGGSVGYDTVRDIGFKFLDLDVQYLIEEGSKLMGIAGWLGYFGWICYISLDQLHRPITERVE